MTSQILQSDIELAKKLLDDSSPETVIIEMLLRRGIRPEEASQLVRDLRDGKPVQPEPLSIAGPKAAPQTSAPEPAGRLRRRRPHQPHRSHATRKAERNVILALALLCVLVIAAVVLWQWPNRKWPNRKAGATFTTPASKPVK